MWFLTARKLKWDEGLLVGFVLVRLRPQQVARCGRQVRAGEWCDIKTVCHHPPTQHRDQPTHSQHYTAYRQHHGHGKIGTASAALMRACLNISLIWAMARAQRLEAKFNCATDFVSLTHAICCQLDLDKFSICQIYVVDCRWMCSTPRIVKINHPDGQSPAKVPVTCHQVI